MMIRKSVTIKNSSPNYSYIKRDDIQPGLKFGIDEFTNASYENIAQILSVLNRDIEAYLKKYNESYLNFQRQNRIVRKIKSLPTSLKQSDQSVPVKVAIDSKSYQNEKKATLEFIQTLEMGKYLLHKTRTLLTGNAIQTKITVQTSDGVYLVDQDSIKDYITPVLSTYGGSTINNPFSLAYSIDVALLQEQKILNESNKISQTNIFAEIWKVKVPYLVQFKGWSETYAKRRQVFNSKDAEIYDLMSQLESQSPNSMQGWLNVSRYASLRANMGGGGGYRTSQLKSGDVGLIQDKFITEKRNNVNIIRQQMIKEKLEQLLKIVTIPLSQSTAIKEELKKMFTENAGNINNLDTITQITNREAQKFIDSLFKT